MSPRVGCRVKIHKEHLDNARANKVGEKQIAPCKVYYDANAAKELLLLASSVEKQQQWIACLRKKIEQGGYAAANSAVNQSMRHQSNLSINSNSSAGGNGGGGGGVGGGGGNGNGNGGSSYKSFQSQMSRNSAGGLSTNSATSDLQGSEGNV